MYLKLFLTFLILSPLSLFATTTGDASWYGEKFQGKTTASGEPFDMNAFTTAHRTLPFGTLLKVTNLSNHKSVEVRVNDRGPFKESRIVDLSYAAAKKIGLVQEGVAKVSIQEISSSKHELELEDKSSTKAGEPYLTDEEEINSMQEYAIATYPESKITAKDEYVTEEEIYEKNNPYDRSSVSQKVRVQIGAFSSKENAERFLKEEKGKEYTLEIVEKNQDRILYKVIITCNSPEAAQEIISSKEYNGAYIIH
jgi:rare lipoprotein A